MRQAYVDIVGEEHSTIEGPNATFDGFNVKVYAGQSPGRGRGVFADQFIKKGELIYNCRQTAQFRDGLSFRKFLMRIPTDLACDVLSYWSYTEDLGVTYGGVRGLRIMTDLDEMSLCNGGRRKSNVGLNKKAAKKVKVNYDMAPMFATRDIKRGEELRCNYEEFSARKWSHFGL
jgi:hypothetical protein